MLRTIGRRAMRNRRLVGLVAGLVVLLLGAAFLVAGTGWSSLFGYVK